MAELFVAFILFFYVPTLLFRFFANTNIDLASRKFGNQIEDFFAAAVPSFLLNLLTWLLLNTLTYWHLTEVTLTMPTMLTDGYSPFLRQHFGWISLYYFLLCIVSAASGFLYGWVDLQLTEWPLDDVPVPAAVAGVREEFWQFALFFHGVWQIFFEPEKVGLFPLIATRTFVFVRTTDGRRFHGLFERYDRTADGQFTSIRLTNVVRLDDWNKAVSGEATYFVNLSGTLLFKWEEVADVNIADLYDPATLKRLELALANAKAERAAQAQKKGGWQLLRELIRRQ
ncbi:MAG TPA: hypothetical protein VJ276_08980 [Thermoanaerobaculia bacterium]|nr:hypothetical protein [Thermoanaerobaculia bacterium]